MGALLGGKKPGEEEMLLGKGENRGQKNVSVQEEITGSRRFF